MISALFTFTLAFALVAVAMPFVRRAALRNGFVDAPGGRKSHKDPTPPIGGLVLFPIFILISWFSVQNPVNHWPFYCALALIVITGAIDDYKHINPWPRFVLQFITAFLIVVPGGAQLSDLGNLIDSGSFEMGVMTIPFSMLAVALLINAINMLDGLDGLAGGMSFVILFWFALAGLLLDQLAPLLYIAPLLGALAGFLFYNMRSPLRTQASVFLGDCGSMGLGLAIAWFAIGMAQNPSPIMAPISVAWVLAFPIIDATAQMMRRLSQRKHPFSADRGHFHHHLINNNISSARATNVILLIGFIFATIGYGAIYIGLPQWVLTFGWIIMLFAHIILSIKPKYYALFLKTINTRPRAH